MSASFAATPARGAKIVVMGERGTLIAEQPGPNPMEDGSSLQAATARRCSRWPRLRNTRRSPTTAIIG